MLMDYKQIEDTLTDSELNGIVSLIQNCKTLTENIHIKDNTITGEYGNYIFNLQSTTIVDNGILITDETLTNLGTVKLTNPVFTNATYTLYLTVYIIEDANIMDDETISNIEETTLEIELTPNTPVQIPFTTLNKSCIVSFDANISIKQDKPVIKGDIIQLLLTSNKTTISSGETCTLTVYAHNLNGTVLEDVEIDLYKGATKITTLTTDDEGEASYTYTGTGAGTTIFKATYQSINSNELTITDNPLHVQSLTLSSNKSTILEDETATLTATLTEDGTPLTSKTVTFLMDGSSVGTGTTNSNGEATYSYVGTGAGSVVFKATYDTVESSTVTITDNPHVYAVGLVSNKASIIIGEYATLTATVTRDSSPLSGVSVDIYQGATKVTTSTTDANGQVSFSFTGISTGTFSFKAVYGSVESSSVSVTVSTPPVSSIGLIGSASIIQSGDTSVLTVTALDSSSQGVSGVSIDIYKDSTKVDTITTDSNGQGTYTYTGTGAGDMVFYATDGTVSSSNITVEDCLIYDPCSTDKTSDYTSSYLTGLAFDTDHYLASRTASSSSTGYFSPIYVDGVTLPTDFEASVDIKLSSKVSTDWMYGLCVSDTYTTTYSGTNQCFNYHNTNRCTLGYRVSGSLTNYGAVSSESIDTWYKFSIKVEGTSVTSKMLKEDDTVVYTTTQTLSSIQSWKKLMLIIGGTATGMQMKNYKLKQL